MKKIVFMGSDAIALPLLDWLHWQGPSVGARLLAVFSQPDRPKGRGKKLQPNPISEWAISNGVELFRPEKPDAETEKWMQREGIELVLVMAYGHMLKKSLLGIPPCGFVNFHASLLPKYRGASPIETAVASGESETGVSLMKIIPKMDAGAVFDTEKVSIEQRESAGLIREKLANACVPLIERNFSALLDGSATCEEQSDAEATYCRKLEKVDGALDFSVPAKVLAARINGLDPWPGCFANHGDVRLKLKDAWAEAEASTATPGTLLEPTSDAVRIATGAGVLYVGALQRPGGKLLPAQEFLRGYNLEPGTILSNALMSCLVQQEPFKTRPGHASS